MNNAGKKTGTKRSLKYDSPSLFPLDKKGLISQSWKAYTVYTILTVNTPTW